MEFPGNANTNIHLISGFSSIYWRIYTEESGTTHHPPETPANGYFILKHLSRLKDLETRLRSLKCLVSFPRRLGLWVFSPTPDFESLGSLYAKEENGESNKLLVDSTTLKVSASGSITSLELVKNLSDAQSHHGTQSTAAHRPQQGPTTSRRTDGYNSSAAIYSSFISAVTGAISHHIARCNGALPLGSRTLFTAVEKSGYESPRIDNANALATSSLTTLNVQLIAVGKLIVSFQAIPQVGLTWLCTSRDDVTNVLDVQPGTDLWLCPNGTIARLVTANIDSPTVPSPGYSATGNTPAKRRQWKLDVLQWLANFGLQVDSVDEETWVEVEVWEPFFSRLAGEAWRQSDDSQHGLPLKRILWPARFCFKRTRTSAFNMWNQNLLEDPLDFAERWSATSSSLKMNQDAPNNSASEEAQTRDLEMPSPKQDYPENMESLSRIAQYPDLQTINLVYPTPPDGATALGLNNANTSDALPEDFESGLSHATAQNTMIEGAERGLSPDDAPVSGLGVGSGFYDASDDEDLFGEINDKDFDPKGITDADFSFFDDPGLESMDGSTQVNDQSSSKPPQGLQNTDMGGVFEEKPPPGGGSSGTLGYIEADPTPLQAEQKEQKALQQDDGPMDPGSSALLPRGRTGQTVSPPLSPAEIKKILFSGPDTKNNEHFQGSREQGHYHPVTFEKNLGDWDQKYGKTGKFWFFSREASNLPNEARNAIPTIGLPHHDKHAKTEASPTKHADHKGSPPELLGGRLRSASSSSSGSSDDSDEMVSERVPTTMALPTLKRKRVSSDADILSATSREKPSSGPEPETSYKTENSAFLGNFLANFSDWSLNGYFSAIQAPQRPILVRREEQMQVAQLVADQITQSSLDHGVNDAISLFYLENEDLSLWMCLDDAAFWGETANLDLKGYTSVQEDVTTGSSRQSPKETGKGLISKLPVPHVRVRRGNEFLEALPSTTSFWETFGLEPAHGPKNVSAYCIHPPTASKAADIFLKRLGLLYQSCGLGNHDRGDKSKTFDQGLATWGTLSSGASNYIAMMRDLKIMCEELGTALSQAPPTQENCVVYIINPFTHAAAVADVCAAFWQLFKKSVADADRRQARQANELALQIIPLSFIMSGDSMIVPSQTDYLNLALEVYSRCPPKDMHPSFLLSAPPVLLADPTPKNINFRLAPDQGSPLQDGRNLHVALSRSLDQRWISVAWSDGSGSLQSTMSYCLRNRKFGAARAVAEVRNEIWAMTKHIMEHFQARWRVMLVNTEPVDSDEVEAWANLAEQHNKTRPGSLDMTVLTVSTMPDLVVQPARPPVSMSVFNPPSSSTPVTTPTPNPNASAASPEQSANAATPTSGGPVTYNAPTPTEATLEADSDAVLTDICDESWMAVLSHRLNCSPHVTEFRPALASGYLLRRKGATDGEGVFAMTVNLLYSQRPSASHESVLKETIAMYRDLATLARVRGLRSVQGNTLPWHIATALRAQELLSYVF